LFKAGNNIAINIAIMAITTRSSINVKPLRLTTLTLLDTPSNRFTFCNTIL
jgi:hypothetical protein